jgi:hypothetical protein
MAAAPHYGTLPDAAASATPPDQPNQGVVNTDQGVPQLATGGGSGGDHRTPSPNLNPSPNPNLNPNPDPNPNPNPNPNSSPNPSPNPTPNPSPYP